MNVCVDFNRMKGTDGLTHVYGLYQRFALCGAKKSHGYPDQHPNCDLCRAVLYQQLVDQVDWIWGWAYPAQHYEEQAS